MSRPEPKGSNRRQALSAAAGLLAFPALRALAASTLEAPTGDAPYGPFKMGLQSYSLRDFDLDHALENTRELGLGYWESYPAHIPVDAAQAESFRKKAADSGVTIAGFGVIHFDADHDANRKIFDFGKSLGIGYFSADPDPDAFDSLDKCVEEYGIAVGIHNHGPGHRYGPIESIRKAIADHHHRIGCCVDTGHFLRSGEDPVEAVRAFMGRVYGVHLKDVKGGETFTVLGRGDLKTAALLKELADQGYGYCLALEYEENPDSPMEEIRACLAAARAAAPKAG